MTGFEAALDELRGQGGLAHTFGADEKKLSLKRLGLVEGVTVGDERIRGAMKLLGDAVSVVVGGGVDNGGSARRSGSG